MLNGILLIDKPVGTRSTDCVNGVRAALSKRNKGIKVGHAGTLDSTASGLLILLLGAATRLSDAVMTLPKLYRAVLRLGQETDTCDASGQVIFEGDPGRVDEAALDRALFAFLGWRMQRPPKISAVKVNGSPSHKLARAGIDVSPAPRPVFVHSIMRSSPLREGRVEVVVRCGKGTYIRSLARDLGAALGCGAHVESLRRLAVGPFLVENAVAFPLDLNADGNKRPLYPPQDLAAAFHHIALTGDAEERLLSGLPVSLDRAGRCVSGMTVLNSGVCVVGKRMLSFAGRIKTGKTILLKSRVNVLFGGEGT